MHILLVTLISNRQVRRIIVAQVQHNIVSDSSWASVRSVLKDIPYMGDWKKCNEEGKVKMLSLRTSNAVPNIIGEEF